MHNSSYSKGLETCYTSFINSIRVCSHLLNIGGPMSEAANLDHGSYCSEMVFKGVITEWLLVVSKRNIIS